MNSHNIMDVSIFTEGGGASGYGHIVRCMSLYDELLNRGMRPRLIIHGDDSLKDLIGFRAHTFFHWRFDPERFLKERPMAIIDSYLAEEKIYYRIFHASSKLLCLDDTQTIDYPPGIIVNSSFSGDTITYPYRKDRIILAGKDYIVLRKEFQQEQDFSERLKRGLKDNLLIIMGGTDVKGMIIKVMDLVARSEHGDMKQHVVLPENTIKWSECFQSYEIRPIFYEALNAQEMRNLMTACDLAITAAGQTMYELISTKLPFIPISVVQNQDYEINGLLEMGLIDNAIHWSDRYLDKRILQDLKLLRRPDHYRDRMLSFDRLKIGNGTKNIIDAFLKE